MKYMGHIRDGKVVSISVWDGLADWNPEGQVIELPTKEYIDDETGETIVSPRAGVGWSYVGGEFVDDRPQSEEP